MSPVKDFVRDVWKIAAACATGAFLLSLVIGLVAGNPFGIAFFRALLLAVLFAGLGAGLRFVVKTYLPELVEPNRQMAGQAGARESAGYRGAAEGGGAAQDQRGAAVDIVLPEDDGLRRQAYSGSPREASVSSSEPGGLDGEGEPEEALEADSLDEDAASQAEARALGELAEELSEELPGTAAPARSAGAQTDEGSEEEVEPEDELPRSAREAPADLDSLPDIAALEPPSEQRPGHGSPRSTRYPASGERPEDAMRDVLSGQDPSTLARAIRTVLKNEEKG